MIIDLGILGRVGASDGACGAQQRHPAQTMTRPGGRLKLRYVLTTWAALSVIWVAGAAYDIYQRVDRQADMSMDVEHDLDQDLSPASCTGRCLASFQSSQAVNRLDIASTYFKFGSAEMGEFVLGPPAAVLLVGLGAFSVFRRRRSPA